MNFGKIGQPPSLGRRLNGGKIDAKVPRRQRVLRDQVQGPPIGDPSAPEERIPPWYEYHRECTFFSARKREVCFASHNMYTMGVGNVYEKAIGKLSEVHLIFDSGSSLLSSYMRGNVSKELFVDLE